LTKVGIPAGEIIDRWLDYPANWVRLAVIEALYRPLQGDFSRADFSLLNRREQAVYHFNREFGTPDPTFSKRSVGKPTARATLTQPFLSLFISVMGMIARWRPKALVKDASPTR